MGERTMSYVPVAIFFPSFDRSASAAARSPIRRASIAPAEPAASNSKTRGLAADRVERRRDLGLARRVTDPAAVCYRNLAVRNPGSPGGDGCPRVPCRSFEHLVYELFRNPRADLEPRIESQVGPGNIGRFREAVPFARCRKPSACNRGIETGLPLAGIVRARYPDPAVFYRADTDATLNRRCAKADAGFFEIRRYGGAAYQVDLDFVRLCLSGL